MLAAAEEPMAAVLASVEGTVTLTTPDGRAKKAQVFDWLKAGTSIATGGASRAVVVLADGQRFQVTEHSRGTVRDRVLQRLAGKIQQQSGLTEMPRLAAIADARSSVPGLVRIRGPQLQNCYPTPGATILANPAILSFNPVGEGKSYRVEVEDDAGHVIHRAETSATTVTLPEGLLKPGSHYFWDARVVAIGDAPRCFRDLEDFSTLPAEDEARRSALKAAVMQSGDADALALLAEIDGRLGLLREAKEEFTSALEKSSSPDTIRSAIRRIEKLLKDE